MGTGTICLIIIAIAIYSVIDTFERAHEQREAENRMRQILRDELKTR